jgi:hypothetical protein
LPGFDDALTDCGTKLMMFFMIAIKCEEKISMFLSRFACAAGELSKNFLTNMSKSFCKKNCWQNIHEVLGVGLL